jgi:hypothetical protein
MAAARCHARCRHYSFSMLQVSAMPLMPLDIIDIFIIDYAFSLTLRLRHFR